MFKIDYGYGLDKKQYTTLNRAKSVANNWLKNHQIDARLSPSVRIVEFKNGAIVSTSIFHLGDSTNGKHVFNVEYTDTFGGELNYSWVKRFKVVAKSMRGAAIVASRELGINCRINWNSGDYCRYDSLSGCTAFTLERI